MANWGVMNFMEQYIREFYVRRERFKKKFISWCFVNGGEYVNNIIGFFRSKRLERFILETAETGESTLENYREITR